MELASHVHEDILLQYRKLKQQAESALSQVSDSDFFSVLGDEGNSIAVLVKHLAGNMRSRWTDFLTSDGEKSFRDRPSEFQASSADRVTYMKSWHDSWSLLMETLTSLSPDNLLATVTIRHEPHTVLEALHRQLTHYSAHIGQLVLLAKYYRGSEWRTLSIPKDTVQLSGGTYRQVDQV